VLEIPRFQVIDQVIAQLVSAYPQLHPFFQQNITRERSAMIAIKLAALVNNAHALTPLGFSRSEQKWILGILRHLPQLREIVTTPEPVSTYQFCQRVKEFFPALVAIALADGMPLADLQPLLERWLDPCDPIFYPRQLLTGAEIRDQFHLKPSPKIGELLEAVRFAQIRGQIHDRGGALNLVAKLLASTTP
jgi:tRNA nucleotidyltransferase (CCA-adding enzyme)